MTEQTNANTVGDGPQFAILRVYLKGVSFETPDSPAVFLREIDQDIKLQLNTSVDQLEDDTYEVVLSVTVTARQGDSASFLVEVEQAGVFLVKGFDQSQKAGMLSAYCPETLFPFAREAVADLVSKGGFPPLLLAPINFDALHAKNLNRARERAAAAKQNAK